MIRQVTETLPTDARQEFLLEVAPVVVRTYSDEGLALWMMRQLQTLADLPGHHT